MQQSKRPLAGNPSTLADCPKTSRDLSPAHGFFRRRTPAARVECPFPTGSARLRKLLKNASMPRSSPPLSPEAPERTGGLKRDVAVQEGPDSDRSGGVVRMPGTRHSRPRSAGSRQPCPRRIAPKSESSASSIFRHSGITVAFKTTFEVFTRVGPDNSLERLTERSVGLVTDRPGNVYELFVTRFE